jgi:hypothetical protein
MNQYALNDAHEIHFRDADDKTTTTALNEPCKDSSLCYNSLVDVDAFKPASVCVQVTSLPVPHGLLHPPPLSFVVGPSFSSTTCVDVTEKQDVYMHGTA